MAGSFPKSPTTTSTSRFFAPPGTKKANFCVAFLPGRSVPAKPPPTWPSKISSASLPSSPHGP